MIQQIIILKIKRIILKKTLVQVYILCGIIRIYILYKHTQTNTHTHTHTYTHWQKFSKLILVY
jgi:hypothetical protein